MKFKVTVYSSSARHVSGVSEKTHKPYDFYTQDVYVQMPTEPVPQKVTINLNKEADAYQKGEYIMDLSEAFYINRFSSIAINMNDAKFIPDTHAEKAK